MSMAYRESEGYASERPSARPNGVPRTSTVVGFAPFRGPRVCVSYSGRVRAEHAVVGETCCFCAFPSFIAPIADLDDDELPVGSPNDDSLPRNRQHAIEPQGHGLIPPQDLAARQPGHPLLVPSDSAQGRAAGGPRYPGGRPFVFRARTEIKQHREQD